MKELYLKQLRELYDKGELDEETLKKKLDAFKDTYDISDEEVEEFYKSIKPKSGARLRIEELKQNKRDLRGVEENISNSYLTGALGLTAIGAGALSFTSLSKTKIFAAGTYAVLTGIGAILTLNGVKNVVTSIKEKTKAKKKYKIEKIEKNKKELKNCRGKVFDAVLNTIGGLGITGVGALGVASVYGALASGLTLASVASLYIGACGAGLLVGSAMTIFESIKRKTTIKNKIDDIETDIKVKKMGVME